MRSSPDKPWLLLGSMTVLIISFSFLLSSYLFGGTSDRINRSIFCSNSPYSSIRGPRPSPAVLSTQITETVLHYAKSTTVPQQTEAQIRVSLPVIIRRRPCNFLVFGLGFDSQMWASFNLGGRTLFLEHNPMWVNMVVSQAPFLNARTVRYRTRGIREAGELLQSYRTRPTCLPAKAFVKGNKDCKLALHDLPEEVYETEWDAIMIDAPPGGPIGRMGPIWTAAVMARNRKGDGVTDVFLHDVNRKVEREFALEFLCERHRVNATNNLWHFQIPKAGADATATSADSFC